MRLRKCPVCKKIPRTTKGISNCWHEDGLQFECDCFSVIYCEGLSDEEYENFWNGCCEKRKSNKKGKK